MWQPNTPYRDSEIGESGKANEKGEIKENKNAVKKEEIEKNKKVKEEEIES